MKRIIILIFFIPLIGISQSSNSPSKAELAKIYSQAIADFIKAVNENHQTSFDTLFFGKHVYGQPDDFPNIELPEAIENTQIRLITPEDGLIKQQARKSLVYINMIGWVEQKQAEFIFVTFSNGGEHQYDYFIDYIYIAERKSWKVEKGRFEYYLYKNKP
ncbi:MAG: hypothetical protein NTW16_00885 [Bacteroidetes bacterium]|nr:hypothetical protein [Bacteroidota bacterium]